MNINDYIMTLSLTLIQFVNENNIDIAFITETWLKDNDTHIISELSKPPYIFNSYPRIGHAGGIGILHKSTISLTTSKHLLTSSAEIVICSFSWRGSVIIKTIIIYRPPNLDFKQFLADFTIHIQPIITKNTIILGDLNIHVNNTTLKSSILFNSTLINNSLEQHIKFPTQVHGNTLD